MLDLFIIALMTAIFGALLFGYQTARKKGKEIVQEKNKFENMSNNQLNSITTVNYRGEDIPMTVLEKRQYGITLLVRARTRCGLTLKNNVIN